MSVMGFYKVEALPTELVPNAIYFVPDGTTGLMTICVTDGKGEYVRSTPSANAIQAMARAAASTTLVMSVANYAALRTLDTSVTRVAFVIDASGDSTVTSGAATYIFNVSIGEWVKVAEFESMDMVLNWSNLTGKPNSTPSAIDTAVSNSHTHANKAIIDRIALQGNGRLAYQPSTGPIQRLYPMRYFKDNAEVLGEVVAFTTTVQCVNGIWSANFAHMNFISVVDYWCSGVYKQDGVSYYSLPSIDERLVTNTSIGGYSTTRVGAGALVAVELTKADNGWVKVTVIGVIANTDKD